MVRRKESLQIQPIRVMHRYNATYKPPNRPVWQEPPSSRQRSLRNFIVLFFRQNSIHGLVFLVKKGLTLMERFFWLILMIGSLVCCVLIGLQSVDRYKTKSTVTSVERDYYTWRTKLPGVTICPMVRLNKDLFDDYCRLNNIEGQRKVEFFDFLENLANSTYINFDRIPQHDSIDGLLKELHLKSKDYMKLIYKLTGDATLSKDPSKRISTHTKSGDIHTRQVLTEWGLCYNTNTVLGLENTAHYMLYGQTPEEYRKTEMSYTAPEGSYFDTGISYQIFGFNSHLIMYVHSAYDVLDISKPNGYITVSIDVEVETKEVVTERYLQDRTTVSQRNCRFPNESNLKHFPIYTKHLCLEECRLKLAYRLCKCIPHFYPNDITKPKPVCSYKQLRECFPDKKEMFLQIFRFKSKSDFNCECLNNCRESNVYITQTIAMNPYGEFLDILGVILRINKFPTERLKREIIFTFTDLLVSIGGTAGFFLGFSILGAIEIMYHFSLRLYWFLRAYV